jgi:hypothetical protein
MYLALLACSGAHARVISELDRAVDGNRFWTTLPIAGEAALPVCEERAQPVGPMHYCHKKAAMARNLGHKSTAMAISWSVA